MIKTIVTTAIVALSSTAAMANTVILHCMDESNLSNTTTITVNLDKDMVAVDGVEHSCIKHDEQEIFAYTRSATSKKRK